MLARPNLPKTDVTLEDTVQLKPNLDDEFTNSDPNSPRQLLSDCQHARL